MTAKIVIGLNYGDESKGSIVDYLCSQEPVDLVVRFNGGFQAAHNVVNHNRHHTFSQFGSGSFWDVPTFITNDVIVNPEAMISEYKALKAHNIDPKIYVNSGALVATSFHRNANRALDCLNHHGSCGVGIGLTREMWAKTGVGVTWEDLSKPKKLQQKLSFARQWCQDKLLETAYSNNKSAIKKLDTSLKLSGSIFEEAKFLTEARKYCDNFIDESIPNIIWGAKQYNRKLVFEGSQGIGLDEAVGTIPHTTYSRTTPELATELCDELGLEYEIIGVTRSFETRHGNGPMFDELNHMDISSDHNHNNGSFAGKFRTGSLNYNWINQVLEHFHINSLAVTWLDKVRFDFDKITSKVNKLIQSSGPDYTSKKEYSV